MRDPFENPPGVRVHVLSLPPLAVRARDLEPRRTPSNMKIETEHNSHG